MPTGVSATRVQRTSYMMSCRTISRITTTAGRRLHSLMSGNQDTSTKLFSAHPIVRQWETRTRIREVVGTPPPHMIEWSAADELYFVSHPNRLYLSAHGSTRAEALNNYLDLIGMVQELDIEGV